MPTQDRKHLFLSRYCQNLHIKDAWLFKNRFNQLGRPGVVGLKKKKKKGL